MSNKAMAKKAKTFDAVAWTRAHRDANYRRYGDLPLEEFAKQVAERGQQSALWKRITQRGRPVEENPSGER